MPELTISRSHGPFELLAIAAIVVLPFLLAGCVSDERFKEIQTAKLLGVPVQKFPPSQGLTSFDELPSDAPSFKFEMRPAPIRGPEPRWSIGQTRLVSAVAPDGAIYEAYCGENDPKIIVPGHGFVSTLDNRRQRYGTLYFVAEYSPDDVYIGKRQQDGRIRPTLFFRDVGVHNDAPHSIAIDKAGHCHLIIADGNNFRKDRFDLYWMIGNPVSGKWENAFLIDGRDFISSPRPLVIASGDDIHLLWNRQASRNEDQATESGLFYVERVGNHFGRKVRLISGEVRSWDAAIDLRSGRVVAAISRGDGVYVASLVHHRWTRPTKLPVFEARETDVVVTAASGGFLINTRLEQRDYLLLPK